MDQNQPYNEDTLKDLIKRKDILTFRKDILTEELKEEYDKKLNKRYARKSQAFFVGLSTLILFLFFSLATNFLIGFFVLPALIGASTLTGVVLLPKGFIKYAKKNKEKRSYSINKIYEKNKKNIIDVEIHKQLTQSIISIDEKINFLETGHKKVVKKEKNPDKNSNKEVVKVIKNKKHVNSRSKSR